MHVTEIPSYGGGFFSIYLHPAPQSNVVVVNIPGLHGHIDGYNNKYRVLGEHLARRGLGTYVQMPHNSDRREDAYGAGLVGDLTNVCDFCIEYGRYQLGTNAEPELYLVGFSNGAGAVAAVASTFRQIIKILLMEPAIGVGEDLIKMGLSAYTGELYVVTGEGPEAIGPGPARAYFLNYADRARRCELVTLPNCDHQFRGRENGQRMAKAHDWAFAGDTTFPDPKGGLVLYE